MKRLQGSVGWTRGWVDEWRRERQQLFGAGPFNRPHLLAGQGLLCPEIKNPARPPLYRPSLRVSPGTALHHYPPNPEVG